MTLTICAICSTETPEEREVEGCSGHLHGAFLGFPSLFPYVRKPILPNLRPSPTAICWKEVALQFFTGSHRPPLPSLSPSPTDPGPLLAQSPFKAGSRNALPLALPSVDEPSEMLLSFPLNPCGSGLGAQAVVLEVRPDCRGSRMQGSGIWGSQREEEEAGPTGFLRTDHSSELQEVLLRTGVEWNSF